MTWAFSLSAECGVAQGDAEVFAQHFDGRSWTLASGIRCQSHTDIFQDIEENWWCRVCPDGLSESGIETPDTAYTMTEIGILLYQHLRLAPPFRYALVGIEVDEFRTYRELMRDPAMAHCPGLVVAEPIWQGLGSFATFRAFRPGYRWQPYEGEVYRPLTTSPDLKNKLDELLALV